MIRGWSWLTGGSGSGGGNAFGIIQTPAGTSPTATTTTDTLNLTSSDGSITITGNSGTKTVDFSTGSLSNAQTTLTTTGNITAMPIATNYIRYINATATNIQGIAATANALKIVIYADLGGLGITLIHQSASATAANRLALSNLKDFFIQPGKSVYLIYNTTALRWNLLDYRYELETNGGLTGNPRNLFSSAGGVPPESTSRNVIIGAQAISAGTFSGSACVIIGASSGLNINGSPSLLTIVGANSGNKATTANTIIGGNSAPNLTSGSENISIGVSVLPALTTGSQNVAIGGQGLNDLTTGTQNIAIGGSVTGLGVTTGNSNIFLGCINSVSTGSTSNTICIGTNIAASTSNVMLLGGTSNPVFVGINNITPAYRLDVGGDINISSGNVYRIGGVPFTGWQVIGNSGLTSGVNFIGTTDLVPFDVHTNAAFTARFDTTGLLGVQTLTPVADFHAGIKTETVSGNPVTMNVNGYTIGLAGFPFGTGTINYSVYAGRTILGTNFFGSTGPANTSTTEPTEANYEVTSLSATDQPTASIGYDPNISPLPSYQIWSLYASDTAQGTTPPTIALAAWTSFTQNQDVLIQWTVPAGGQTPSSYFIVRNGIDYQSAISGGSTSLLDTNTGWTIGIGPGLPDIHYTVDLNYGSVADAEFYRILNSTNTSFMDVTAPTLSVTDDDTWSSGSTVTPTSYVYKGFITDGDVINVTTPRTVTNSTDSGDTGDICWDTNYIYMCVGTNTWKRVAITTY